ncbi:MAG: hypothetical protein K2M01_08700 [Paramuribaculum sp.]|nr:hypothetical protein [Paramuribaculum sp.]
MKYSSILFLILSMTITSCQKNDDPGSPSSRHRISFIYSAKYTQLFDYDPDGKIKKWRHVENPASQTIAAASYIYSADESTIQIDAEELHGDQRWIFDEVMSLDIDGIAKSAEGEARLYRVKDNSLLMKKRYSVNFSYNSLKQLNDIQIEEKRIIDNGQDPYPLKWNIDFEWNDENLIGYKEYTNPASPLTVYEYTYYDDVETEYAPIVQYPVLRAYYTPLSYQNHFGVLSKCLVKKATVGNNYTTHYSYNISTGPSNSIVEEYFEKTPNDDETKHTIGWE